MLRPDDSASTRCDQGFSDRYIFRELKLTERDLLEDVGRSRLAVLGCPESWFPPPQPATAPIGLIRHSFDEGIARRGSIADIQDVLGHESDKIAQQ